MSAHLAGARPLQLGQQRIGDAAVVGGVHAVGVVEDLVEEVVDVPLGHHEAAATGQLHRVGRRRPVEGRGHRGPPVDHHGIAVLVFDVAPADVPGLTGLGVEAAEAQAVDVGVEAAQPPLEVRLGDRGVDRPGGGLGDRGRRSGAGSHAGEVLVGPVEVVLLGGEVGMLGHGWLRWTRGDTPAWRQTGV